MAAPVPEIMASSGKIFAEQIISHVVVTKIGKLQAKI
jgi:hypothetical protein